MSYNVLAERSYVLYLQSGDKISGNNNNALFNVDWEQFLPNKWNEYKVVFTFQTIAGNYKDVSGTAYYSTAEVAVDFGVRQFCYDTTRRSSSNTIGYISRDCQTTTTLSNTLSCFYYQNPAKSMTRPSNSQLQVSITNLYSSTALVDTTFTGTALTDMTAWQMSLEFIPILSSEISNIKGHNL